MTCPEPHGNVHAASSLYGHLAQEPHTLTSNPQAGKESPYEAKLAKSDHSENSLSFEYVLCIWFFLINDCTWIIAYWFVLTEKGFSIGADGTYREAIDATVRAPLEPMISNEEMYTLSLALWLLIWWPRNDSTSAWGNLGTAERLYHVYVNVD